MSTPGILTLNIILGLHGILVITQRILVLKEMLVIFIKGKI